MDFKSAAYEYLNYCQQRRLKVGGKSRPARVHKHPGPALTTHKPLREVHVMAESDSTTKGSPLEETAPEHPALSKACERAEKSINKLKALAYAVVKGEVPEGRVTRVWAIKFAKQVRHQADNFAFSLGIIQRQWEREISIDNDQIRELLQKSEWRGKEQGEALLDLLYIFANSAHLCPEMSDFNLRWAIREFANDMRERQRLNNCERAKVCIEKGTRCKYANKPKAQVLPLQIVRANQGGHPQTPPEGEDDPHNQGRAAASPMF
jgi:hypothetical protein